MVRHAVTVDLEDWHQLLRRRIGRSPGEPSPGLSRATRRMLDVFDAAGVKATFFVLGMVADAQPDLVREVARRGHEIGSHSHAHRLIHSMTPAAFRDEMRRARGELQELTGQQVLGFRAPEFSVQHLGHWAFEVLAETGFTYDSSVFPSHARYGIPEASRRPFVLRTPSGSLLEFPLATWEVLGQRLPVAGGSYYRFLPARLLVHVLQRLGEEGTPATLYVHPYEFQGERLRLDGLSGRERWLSPYAKYEVLHNLFPRRIGASMALLLRSFRFRPLGEAAREGLGSPSEGA
jgi:polysaccharide deacetylase family protein (PEP-CTERM system associated)